jgi:phytoene dehydrogenase-like protein
MAATWVLFMTSPAGAALGPDLAAHGMKYCHTAHPTAVLRPNGEALVCTTDQAANIAMDKCSSFQGLASTGRQEFKAIAAWIQNDVRHWMERTNGAPNPEPD